MRDRWLYFVAELVIFYAHLIRQRDVEIYDGKIISDSQFLARSYRTLTLHKEASPPYILLLVSSSPSHDSCSSTSFEMRFHQLLGEESDIMVVAIQRIRAGAAGRRFIFSLLAGVLLPTPSLQIIPCRIDQTSSKTHTILEF